jgi:hypothetical protein
VSQVPAELIAGDTWEWSAELEDYPAPTWASNWYFERLDYNFSVTGVPSGATHTATVAAATSAAYKPGEYRWRLVVSAAGVRKTVESGRTRVLIDPAAAGNADYRTTAAVVLDMIDTYLRDPGNLNAANYSLNGRSLSRWSRADLLVERDKWKLEVKAEEAAERMASGLGNPRRLYVRFVRG